MNCVKHSVWKWKPNAVHIWNESNWIGCHKEFNFAWWLHHTIFFSFSCCFHKSPHNTQFPTILRASVQLQSMWSWYFVGYLAIDVFQNVSNEPELILQTLIDSFKRFHVCRYHLNDVSHWISFEMHADVLSATIDCIPTQARSMQS